MRFIEFAGAANGAQIFINAAMVMMIEAADDKQAMVSLSDGTQVMVIGSAEAILEDLLAGGR